MTLPNSLGNDLLSTPAFYRAPAGATGLQKTLYDADPRNMSLEAGFGRTPKVANEYLGALKSQYTPIMGDYTRDLRGLDIVGETRDAMIQQQGLLAGRNQRERGRYGAFMRDPATRAYAQYQSDLGNSVTAAGMLNNARIQQNDMQEAGRRSLISLGRGMTQDALAAAGIASGSQSRMDQAAAQNDAAQKAQNAQMASAAASMMLLLLL